MNASSFDFLTTALTSARSRRAVVRALTAGGIAAVFAGRFQDVAARPDKVTICHVTRDPVEPYLLITVAEPALRAHFAHGDVEPFTCDGRLSCEECPPDCDLLPLFCESETVCPTGATAFCPGGSLDPTSSDQASAACEACFGAGACVHNDLDCSGAGWLQAFAPQSEPTPGAPVFGYEDGLCNPDNPQPPGRVYFATASDPLSDYGSWGTDVCP